MYEENENLGEKKSINIDDFEQEKKEIDEKTDRQKELNNLMKKSGKLTKEITILKTKLYKKIDELDSINKRIKEILN